MSLPLSHQNLTRRCDRLARLIADQLADRQRNDGEFPMHSFYAKAFALVIWQHIDPAKFARPIKRVRHALIDEPHDARYHREFIEYALHHLPHPDPDVMRAVIRKSRNRAPDVANWQLLARLNRGYRPGRWRKLIGHLHRSFIRWRYWRDPVFLDRPGCFSAQYHAFCTALICESQPRMASRAAALLAELAGQHGMVNLLGRGAGQSFGAVSALYALLFHGQMRAADAILFRLEDAILRTGTLPLNPLFCAPLPDAPGPDNPATPGWYSYNRHDDYLAFAGFWLWRAGRLALPVKHRDIPPVSGVQDVSDVPDTPDIPVANHRRNTPEIAVFSTDAYQAHMSLAGRHSFDVTPCPVVIVGRAENTVLLLPPTGGEEDGASLHHPGAVPLPGLVDGMARTHARFTRAERHGNRVTIHFTLAGQAGTRDILFDDTAITLRDRVDGLSPDKLHLFRILTGPDIRFAFPSNNRLRIIDHRIEISSRAALKVEDNRYFSAAGPARMIYARGHNQAELHFHWHEAPDAG